MDSLQKLSIPDTSTLEETRWGKVRSHETSSKLEEALEIVGAYYKGIYVLQCVLTIPDHKDQTMTDTEAPSREEVNAKIETVEARLDSKLATINGKLDRMFDRMELVVNTSNDAKDAANKARNSASTIKWNILFTAVGVVATLFAAWAIWSQGMELVATVLGVGMAR